MVKCPPQMGRCCANVMLKESQAAEIVTIGDPIRLRIALLASIVLDAIVCGKSAIDLEGILDATQDSLAQAGVVELEVSLEAEIRQHQHCCTLCLGSRSLRPIIAGHASCFGESSGGISSLALLNRVCTLVHGHS